MSELIDGLTRDQHRIMFDTLCDGVEETVFCLTYMRQFKDYILMLFWLRRNRIQGQKLVDLFRTKGNLQAVQYIRDRMQGRNYTTDKIQVGDLA